MNIRKHSHVFSTFLTSSFLSLSITISSLPRTVHLSSIVAISHLLPFYSLTLTPDKSLLNFPGWRLHSISPKHWLRMSEKWKLDLSVDIYPKAHPAHFIWTGLNPGETARKLIGLQTKKSGDLVTMKNIMHKKSGRLWHKTGKEAACLGILLHLYWYR